MDPPLELIQTYEHQIMGAITMSLWRVSSCSTLTSVWQRAGCAGQFRASDGRCAGALGPSGHLSLAQDPYDQSLRAPSPLGARTAAAVRLAGHVLTGATRVRRDLNTLLSLIQACAILHQAQRQRIEDGRIIATLDDYTAGCGPVVVADRDAWRP